jgi:hypothetical protein
MGFYPQGAVSGSSNAPPFAVSIASYGALPATMVTDAVATSGGPTVTSASGGFKGALIGQPVMVAGAGATVGTVHSTYVGTIASVNAAGTSATVNANFGNTTTAPNGAIWGPDNTAAIRAAQAAALAVAKSPFTGSYSYELYTPPNAYMIGGATATLDTSQQGNARIAIPLIAPGGQKMIISYTGARDSSHLVYFNSSLPQVAGSCWVDATTNGVAYGAAPTNMTSCLGGPTPVNGYGANTSLFNNVLPLVDGLTVVGPWNPAECAFDFSCCAEANVQSASALAFANPTQMAGNSSASITNFTPGLAMPGQNNNDDSNIWKYSCEGWGYGFMPSEHTYCANARLIYNYSAVVPNQWTTGNMAHSLQLEYVSAEACQVSVNAGLLNGQTVMNIAHLDCETTASHVTDSGNNLWGTCYINSFGSSILVTGAANYSVFNMRLQPGIWGSAPAAPASGVAQQNTAWKYATVVVSGAAAISQVQVGGTTTGQTAVLGLPIPVRVPPGKTWSATDAGGALTVGSWILD